MDTGAESLHWLLFLGFLIEVTLTVTDVNSILVDVVALADVDVDVDVNESFHDSSLTADS